MKLDLEKLPIIYKVMQDNKIDAWLITGRESMLRSEPVLPVLGDIDFIIATTLIFTANKCLAIVSPLDVVGYQAITGIDEVIEYKTTMDETIGEVLIRLNPKRLALNYSKSDASSDGLTLGMHLMLERVFERIDYQGEIISAFPIISKVRGIKTSSQISKIKDCVVQADKYLRQVPEICRPNMTSIEIYNFLQEIAYQDGYKMSWAASQCPSVMVDPNVPQGHGPITDTPLVKGYLVNIDYGISKNGYCSDLQRMYYVLKDDEDDAPKHIKEAFYLVRDAILAAKEFMRPGVTGFEVDQIARHMIVDNGYDSWNAALGHQVGHVTHDGGTILANRRPRYNRPELIDTPLDAGNVFTIEPSVEIAEGRICIEEDVVITDTGAKWLVEPQRELILIRI